LFNKLQFTKEARFTSNRFSVAANKFRQLEMPKFSVFLCNRMYLTHVRERKTSTLIIMLQLTKEARFTWNRFRVAANCSR